MNRSTLQSLEPRRHFAADVSISAIDIEPIILAPGQAVQATYTIANTGDAATGKPSLVRSVLSRDKVFGNADDINLGTSSYNPSIAAGASAQLQITGATGLSFEPGVYRLGAFVDSGDFIVESNETNNATITAKSVVQIAAPLNGDSLAGTNGDDRIGVFERLGKVFVTLNGAAFWRNLGNLQGLSINAGGGNDRVIADDAFPVNLAVTGAGGNDTLVGGAGNDELSGANGRDVVSGGRGNDYLLGGAGNDKLFGDAGRDTLSGAGGNDRLVGGAGFDKLFGGAGNDRLITNDIDQDRTDTVSGNAGTDTLEGDTADVVAGVEVR